MNIYKKRRDKKNCKTWNRQTQTNRNKNYMLRKRSVQKKVINLKNQKKKKLILG